MKRFRTSMPTRLYQSESAFATAAQQDGVYSVVSMKQEASFFEGKEPVLIYIAKRLKDALRLENIFSEAGLDYGVEADEYRAGVIFRTVRAGAFFYVLEDSVA